MKPIEKEYDVGVIIGRFQINELHEAHTALIEHVINSHKKVLIMLGVSPLLSTKSNPLDYVARVHMIQEKYPDVILLPLTDYSNDDVWSAVVDGNVDSVARGKSVVIYGGRGSFIKSYTGKHDTRELVANDYEANFSATQARAEISGNNPRSSADFRAGVIWGVHNRFPISYSTVDIAIFDEHYANILIGRKPKEEKWRLPGGFVDVTDATLEAAASREAAEETSLSLTIPEYISSHRIEDWRYRSEPDKIMTHLFGCRKIYGGATAGDDLAEVKWVALNEIVTDKGLNNIVSSHEELILRACFYAQGKPGYTIQEGNTDDGE